MNTKFKTQFKVTTRFSDVDAFGHVNNACFFSFMEEGRVNYFKKIFPEKSILDFSLFPFILAEAKCSYKKPVFCHQTLIVALGVTHIGTKSFTMEYDLFETTSQDLVATGQSIQVMFDYDANQSIKIPQSFKDKLNEQENNKLF